MVGERGYASHGFRDHIWKAGARPAIPTKRNEAPVACPSWVCNNRNIVERLWAHLKEWRAVATRYEKTAVGFTGVLCLAATLQVTTHFNLALRVSEASCIARLPFGR